MANESSQVDKKTLISIEQRRILIAKHPCFSTLNSEEIDELANLAVEQHFTAQDTIVSKGNIVNFIYLIASGTIEVDTEAKGEKKSELVPQVLLHECEAIGLSDTGFFSQNGVRTATLIAVTDVT